MLDVTLYGVLTGITEKKREYLIHSIASCIAGMGILGVTKESVHVSFRVDCKEGDREIVIFIEKHLETPKLTQETKDQLATKVGLVCDGLLDVDLVEACIWPVNPVSGFWSSRLHV